MSIETYKRDYQSIADSWLNCRAEDFSDWREFEEEFCIFLNRLTLLTPSRHNITEQQADIIEQEVRSGMIKKFMEGLK